MNLKIGTENQGLARQGGTMEQGGHVKVGTVEQSGHSDKVGTMG